MLFLIRTAILIVLSCLAFVQSAIAASSCVERISDSVEVIKTVVRQTQFPYRELNGSRLELDGKTWRLMNVGQRQEDADRAHITALYNLTEARFQRKNPNGIYSHVVEFEGALRRAHKFLDTLRDSIYTKVYDKYTSVKNYIAKNWDITLLKMSDFSESRYDDTLVLIPDTNLPIEKAHPTLLGKSALMTISLIPGHPFLLRRLTDMRGRTNDLPFMTRMDVYYNETSIPQVLMDVLAKYHCAEISRYVMFQDGIPRPIVAKLLLRILELGANREDPVEIFFASVDTATSKAFRRFYHFKRVEGVRVIAAPNHWENETEPTETNEELLYLKVGSPEYQRLVEELRILSANVAELP